MMRKYLDYNFDIIAVSGSKLKKGISPTTDINIPTYTYEHTPTEAEKGGTLIYVSEELNYKPRKDLEIYIPKTVESTFIEVVDQNSKNKIIGCIYKHHNITEKEFMCHFLPVLRKIKKENKPCEIAGDFNINLLNSVKNIDQALFYNETTSLDFMPLITVPTRITSKSKTLIDNIIVNHYDKNIISGNITVGISDHIPQFSLIPTKKYFKKIKSRKTYRRNFKQMDTKIFKSDLESSDWSFSSQKDVNKSLEQFVSTIFNNLDKHAPLIKSTKRQMKLQCKPWITQGIQISIRRKDKIYQQMIKEKDQEKKYNLEKRYKILKQKIFNLTRSSKKLHYLKFFQQNSKNVKKLWSGVNEIIQNKPKRRVPIDFLTNSAGDNFTDKTSIANEFNTFFSGIAGDLLKKRKYEGNKNYQAYLKNPNPDSIYLIPVDEIEVKSIIMSLNINKSNGPQSIPNEILKSISEIISAPLTNICNQIFTSGIYPDKLKLAKVIPIYKKDSKSIAANYRPISLLSNINKIFEKLIHKRVYSFLEQNKCIYNMQFGFRKKHSTNDALMSITEKIKSAVKNKDIAVGVFVDLQKAFDTVNHNILLKKLEHYGIRGLANELLKSYLSNREQYVSIDGFESCTLKIEHGVPQGSVLGPLLFLIYINDLHKCIKNSDTFHFADDTNLLHILKKHNGRYKVRKFNVDLKALMHWLLANKISLNATKTEIIYFRDRSIQKPELQIKLNGVKLEPANQIKYLGLLFDEHITWGPYINNLTSKLKRANNLLAISRHYVPRHFILQMYYAQFYSHLTYGCQLWGEKLKIDSPLHTLQKKAIRLITFSDFNAHTGPLFKELKIIKIKDIIEMQNILLAHKVISGNCPANLQNKLKLFKADHSHNTRNLFSSNQSVPEGSIVTNCGSSDIWKNIAKIWNKRFKAVANEHYKSIQYNQNQPQETFNFHKKSFTD